MLFSLQLKPIISDPEYLLDQHILISIKSSDSDESYGKGPRRGATGTIPVIEATYVREGSYLLHKKTRLLPILVLPEGPLPGSHPDDPSNSQEGRIAPLIYGASPVLDSMPSA